MRPRAVICRQVVAPPDLFVVFGLVGMWIVNRKVSMRTCLIMVVGGFEAALRRIYINQFPDRVAWIRELLSDSFNQYTWWVDDFPSFSLVIKKRLKLHGKGNT